MNKLLESLTTVSKNSVDLTPHSIDRSRNIKLLEALEARNKVRVSKNTYKFTNMLDKLKKRDIIQQLENPKAYATNAPERETAERAELLRMAKITASESRDPVTNVPTAEYVKNKENFALISPPEHLHVGKHFPFMYNSAQENFSNIPYRIILGGDDYFESSSFLQELLTNLELNSNFYILKTDLNQVS